MLQVNKALKMKTPHLTRSVILVLNRLLQFSHCSYSFMICTNALRRLIHRERGWTWYRNSEEKLGRRL